MSDQSKELELWLRTRADMAGVDQLNAGLTEESATIQKVTGEVQKHTAAVTEETAAINAATEAQAKRDAEIAARPNIIDNSHGPAPIGPRLEDGSFSQKKSAEEQEASRQYAITQQKEKQAVIDAQNAVEQDKKTANTQRQLALENELVSIKDAERELVVAAAAQDKIKVELLRTEIAARQLIAEDLEAEVATTTQLNEMLEGQTAFVNESLAAIEDRVAARQIELETMQAQLALDEEMIAAEARAAAEEEAAAVQTDRIYGPRSRSAMILKNFMGQGEAMAAGIGIFAGLMVKRAIDEYAKALDKQSEEQDKQSEKMLQQTKLQLDQIENLDSLSGAEKMRVQILGEIAAEQERARFASGEEKNNHEQNIITLESTLNILDSQRDKIAAAQTAAENLKQAFKDDADALKLTLDALDKAKAKQQEQLDFENEKAALIKKNALEELRQQLDLGKITEGQYNQSRGDIDAKSEAERSANKITALQNEVADLKARMDATQTNLSQKISESSDVSGLQQNFARERDAAREKLNAIDKAAIAYDDARAQLEKAQEHMVHNPAHRRQVEEAQANVDKAGADYNKLSADRGSLTTDVQAAQKAYDSLNPYVTEYKKNEEEALRKQREALAVIPGQIAATQTKIAQEKELQGLRQKGADIAAQTAKIEQDKKDQLEQLEIQKKGVQAEIERLKTGANGKESPELKGQIAELQRRQDEIDKKQNNLREPGERAKADNSIIDAKEKPGYDKKESDSEADALINRFGKSVFSTEQKLAAAAGQVKSAGNLEQLHAALESIVTQGESIVRAMSAQNPDKGFLAGMIARMKKTEDELNQVQEQLKNNS